MATTTNYGWTTPDNTAYVKDGASAIRTLGSSIDTTLNSVTSGKNVGALLINSTTVSGAASITVDNVFTSTFANYLLVFSGTTAATTAQTMLLNTRASGTGATANWARMYVVTSDSAGPTRTYAGSQASAAIGIGGDAMVAITATLYSPQIAAPTYLTAVSNGRSSVSADMINGGANHTASTSYDGFIFTASSGNITGTMRVYGLRNS
jgi:hypothetical protein